MTETEKTQTLNILSKLVTDRTITIGESTILTNAHNIIKNTMSEEEIDHRASTYEAEYPQ